MSKIVYAQLIINLILCYIMLCYTISYIILNTNNEQIIILLGCNNYLIQNQRINSLFNYIESTTTPTTIYLSGGSKDGISEPESSIMYRKIHNKYPNVKIYVDPESTNTVENIINFNKWIQNYNKTIKNVVITTSDFHKERVEKIFNTIIKDTITPEWNLSKSNCNWCWDAELTHMKNINNDINNAF